MLKLNSLLRALILVLVVLQLGTQTATPVLSAFGDDPSQVKHVPENTFRLLFISTRRITLLRVKYTTI